MPNSPDNLRELLSVFTSMIRSTALRPTLSGPLVQLLAVRAKFLEQFVYSTVITFRTASIFCFFSVALRPMQAILNKSWRKHPTKQRLYHHLPPITKIRRTKHAGHCWRSRDELVSDVLQWTPLHGRAKAGRTYIQQLCADTGCSPEDPPGSNGW